MAALLVIVFLAAMVGVVKPYINGVKRWQFGLAAFIAFVITGIVGSHSVGEGLEQDFEKQNLAEQSAAAEPDGKVSSVDEAPKTKWSYSEDKDEMRGAVTRFAQVEAEEPIQLDFPYGAQTGLILIRQSPKFGFDVMVGVPSGQIMCNSFTNSHINVKFDDGPIQRFGCTDASDGTSNMVFIEGAKGFLAKLKKSKRAIVEAEFFQNGMQQMKFETEGLDWES